MKTGLKFPLPSKQYMRDWAWIIKHAAELTRKHPGKWIAVHKARVIAVGNDLGQARRLGIRTVGDIEFPVYYLDDGTVLFRTA